jgi:transcriptional/translational regulatory protein YebC/TACO1
MEDQQERSLEVFCASNRVYQLQQTLSDQGFEIVEWGNGYIPMERVAVPETDHEKFAAFLEQLEHQDEVIHVYHNGK